MNQAHSEEMPPFFNEHVALTGVLVVFKQMKGDSCFECGAYH